MAEERRDDDGGSEMEEGEGEESCPASGEAVVKLEPHETGDGLDWDQDELEDATEFDATDEMKVEATENVRAYVETDRTFESEKDYVKPFTGGKLPAKKQKLPTPSMSWSKRKKKRYFYACERCRKSWTSHFFLMKHVLHVATCAAYYGRERIREFAEVLSAGQPKPFVLWPENPGEMGPCEVPLTEKTSSKLDLSGEHECLPAHCKMRPMPISKGELRGARAFVGLAVNEDVMEVRPLMSCENINPIDLRELLHAVMAVLGVSMKDILTTRGSKVQLFRPHKHRMSMMDHYHRQLHVGAEQEPKPPADLTCFPEVTREKSFVSHGMEDEIPAEQMVVNFDLAAMDMGAVGVIIRMKDGDNIIPLFTNCMSNYWQRSLVFFQTILINWIGSEEAMTDMWLATPCGAEGLQLAIHEAKVECYIEHLKPKTPVTCEECGKTFQVNENIRTDRYRFEAHMDTHKTKCGICGLSFSSMNALAQHNNSAHRVVKYPCAIEGCTYVGSMQSYLEKHIEYHHKPVVCAVCGKEVPSRRQLAAHMYWTHSEKKSDLVCRRCGKVGFLNNRMLMLHERTHNPKVEDDNKIISIGYVCPIAHAGCKLYFSKAKYLRRHMQKCMGEDPQFRGKELPPNLRTTVSFGLRNTVDKKYLTNASLSDA